MKHKNSDSQNNESKQTLSKLRSQSQSDKFKAIAKEVEADSDEKTFDTKLSKIAHPKRTAK